MRSAVRTLLLGCQFVCPLLFFTDLTRNPYVTQIVLLNIFLLAAFALLQWDGWRKGRCALTTTPLDLPLAGFAGVCVACWCWSYFGHLPFFRASIRSEGLKAFIFLAFNSIVPFYCAAAAVREFPEEQRPVAPWVFFTAFWGLAWTLFASLRAPAAGGIDVWTHIWDGYGGLLWIAGFCALLWLARGGTLHDYWHAALCVGVLSAVYGILQYFNHELIWPRILNPYGSRSVSTYGNPNFMSSYMVMLLPVAAVYYLKAKTSGTRLVYAAVFLLLEGCLLGSLTRSSWLGAAVALATLAASRQLRELFIRDLKLHSWLLTIAVALVFLWPQGSVSGYSPSVLGRLQELSNIVHPTDGPYSPLYQRVMIWTCAWMMGAENPVLGKGWGVFELFYPFYQGHLLAMSDFYKSMRTHANNSHNELLEMWSQTGLLGVGASVWLWLCFFLCLWRWSRNWEDSPSRQSQADAVWLVAAAASAAGMLADNLLNVSMHFAVPAFFMWWQMGAAMGRPAQRGAASRSLPAGALLALALFSTAAAGAGSWWWVKQWEREVHYFLGFKLLRGSQFSIAIDQLERAYRWHPREVNTDYELGNAYARMDKFDKAVWAYTEALNSNAGYDEIFFNRGTIEAQRLGKFEPAIADYETALWINPLSLDVYNNLGAVYLRRPGVYAERCLRMLQQALHFFPDHAPFQNSLAYLYQLRGEDAEAQALWLRTLETHPEFVEAERNLRASLAKTNRPEPPILKNLSDMKQLEARIAQKDYSTATLELARKLSKALPASMRVHFFLANLEGIHRNVPAAEAEFKRVLELDPGNAYAKQKLQEIAAQRAAQH